MFSNNDFTSEILGMGVQLFALIILLILYVWNRVFKSESEQAGIINGLIFTGIVRCVNYMLLLFLLSRLVWISNSFIGAIMLFIHNVATSLVLFFGVLYIYKKSGAEKTVSRIIMYAVYALTGISLVVFIVNLFTPAYNYISDGNIFQWGCPLHLPLLLASVVILITPVVFIIDCRKRRNTRERRSLTAFTVIPFLCVVSRLFFESYEIDQIALSTSLLAIIIVFFDHISLEEDIRKRSDALRKLALEAEHDVLTGLLRVESFINKACDIIGEDTSKDCCMAIIDIDGFNDINEIYGRQFGDTVLKEAAKNLKSTVRYDDIIGRLGGDEFGMFFQCEIRYFDSVVRKISNAMNFELEGVQITCSIGSSHVSGAAFEYSDIFDLADEALSDAKEEKGTYRLISK